MWKFLILLVLTVFASVSLGADSTTTQSPSSGLDEWKITLAAVSVVVTIASVIVTLWWRGRIAFELKAAELVLSSSYPRAAKRRAQILQALFPSRLPRNFAESFDATTFPGTLKYEMTMELFKAIASNPEKAEEIKASWLELFPEVSWKDTASRSSSGAAPCGGG